LPLLIVMVISLSPVALMSVTVARRAFAADFDSSLRWWLIE
jgi:hypothetical protein